MNPKSAPPHVGNIGQSAAQAAAREPASQQSAWADYVRRSAAGDQGALAALYDETSRLVYATAVRILTDPADADEVTLDVYSQVWRGAAGYTERRGSVVAWLVMLARSRAIDRVRTRSTRSRREEPLANQVEVCSSEPGPEQEMEAGRQRRRVRAALETLPREQREALELGFFSGLTHTELAVRLDQPLGTVKTRIRQGMIKLREILGEAT